MKKTKWIIGGLLLALGSAQAQDITSIKLTDKVLLTDASRIGYNISGDNYYSPPALKRRLSLNFETGHITGFTLWRPKAGLGGNKLPSASLKKLSESEIRALKENGVVTYLTGPQIWTTTKIKDVVQEGDNCFFIVDKPVPEVPAKETFTPFYMYEALDKTSVELGRGVPLINGKDKKDIFQIALNDVPPGSAGWRAFKVIASGGKAADGFALTSPKAMNCLGEWQVTLWVKAAAGNPKVNIAIGDAHEQVPASPQWQKFDRILKVGTTPDKGWLALNFEVADGDVLFDDIEVTKLGEKNPTAFLDDFVNMLKNDLKVGNLRELIMCGHGVDNYLQVPLGQNPQQFDWSITEFYTLCEYIGAEPWHSIPGFVRPDDMKAMAEYLAAPADVGYGKLRAAQGHPVPWTKVFKRIHLQISNEPITFNGNSPHIDTWRSLADALHSSPYYTDNIRLTASTQDLSTGNWLAKDRSVNPPAPKIAQFCDQTYFLTGFWKTDITSQKTPADLFQWLITFVQSEWDESRIPRWQPVAKSAGYEYSVYETSFHTTFGTASSQERNGVITSLGGGMAQIFNLLYGMKYNGARSISQFNLFQFDFSPGGSFGDDFEGKRVRVWGTVLNNQQGQQRYRPIALGIHTINQVIGGDLVETVHEGAAPVVNVTGRWKDTRGEKQPDGKRVPSTEAPTTRQHPALWSFAFKDEKRRGLILMNHDATSAHTVRVEFSGTVKDATARAWTLANDNIYATNEPEAGDPQVKVQESQLTGFASGKEIKLAPFSLTALDWNVE